MTVCPKDNTPLEIARITLGVEGGEAQAWGAPQTRVSEIADGTGSEFSAGDRFAVQIDGKEEVDTYTVQDDNTIKAETPLYWSDRNNHTVNAWYPATDGTIYVGGVTGDNISGTLTACYWGSNPDTGIGYNQAGTTGGTEQVTDGNWRNAVTQMNAALQSAGSEWRYELTGELPTLKKQ